jgi:hypothetical protein
MLEVKKDYLLYGGGSTGFGDVNNLAYIENNLGPWAQLTARAGAARRWPVSALRCECSCDRVEEAVIDKLHEGLTINTRLIATTEF